MWTQTFQKHLGDPKRIQSGTSFRWLCARGSSKHEKFLITSYVGGLPTDSFEKTNQQLGNSRYHDQTAGVTGVATLVADCHAHVKDAQGVDEARSEAQDVLDQLKSEIVTSIGLWLCRVIYLWVSVPRKSPQNQMQRLSPTKDETTAN